MSELQDVWPAYSDSVGVASVKPLRTVNLPPAVFHLHENREIEGRGWK
jgi:hypothetical protein